MKDRRLWRIPAELAILLALHLAGLHAMAHWRVMEQLLSPGGGSAAYLGLALAFLAIRFFVLLLAPGWVAARLFLWAMEDRGRPPTSAPAAATPPARP